MSVTAAPGIGAFLRTHSGVIERAEANGTAKNRAVRFSGWASSVNEDVDGFVIPPESFADSLDGYMQNPVLLYAHDRTRVIGKVTKLDVVPSKGLRIEDAEFDMADPFAAQVGGQVERGFIRGLSVGFRIVEEPKLVAGKLHFIKNRLLEISVAAIPANPDALVGAATEPEVIRAATDRAVGLLEEKAKAAMVEAMEEIRTATDQIRSALRADVAQAIEARVGTVKDLVGESLEAVTARTLEAAVAEIRASRKAIAPTAPENPAGGDAISRMEAVIANLTQMPTEAPPSEGEDIELAEVTRPFANEHACRLKDPGGFVRFRRDNSVDPNIIIGFKKGGGSEAQALRYPKDKWSEAKARSHCREKGGSFEPASSD